MDFLKKLEALNKDAQKEAKLFYEKENKAAGTRLRKIMQEIKAVAQEIREDVSKKKSVEQV